MSEQTGQQDAGNPENGNGEVTAPEWAKGLPENQLSVVTERRFESPGDAIAALIAAETAGTEFKTKAEELEQKVAGFSGQAPNWLEGLDDAGKNLVKQKGWGGQDGKTLVADVLKSYKNLETAFGADKAGRTLLLPKDANDTEALNAIYTRLGRPENAEKYVYKAPEGAQIDNDLVQLSKEIAFESGMNQQQYEKMAKRWDDMIAGRVTEGEAESAEKVAEEKRVLSKEWGPVDGPAWSRMKGLAQNGIKHFGLANGEAGGVIDALEKSTSYAATMKFLAAVGESVTESAGPGDEGRRTMSLTPAEAKEAYGQRKLDKEWMKALTDKNHPGHAEATAERQRFLAAMYPAQQ